MSNEDKSLFNTMEVEHLHEKDSKEEFVANQGVTTTSATEWTVVCAPVKGETYPERAGYRDGPKASWCRLPMALDEMMKAMETECNVRLRKDGHSEMIKEELVGGRLYTG